jgi:hypothetical protein
MVSPGEWGPNAWELLHGIAERVGFHTNMTLIRDEQNEIRMTLRNFWALLPCKTCQLHYREWLQKHPPEQFLQRSGGYLQDEMREWIFRLHEDVNQRREVVSGVALESLRERYKSVNIRRAAMQLKAMYQRGIQQQVLKPEEWKVAWRHLELLLRFMGI